MMAFPALTFAMPITMIGFCAAYFLPMPAWLRHAIWGVACANILVSGLYDDLRYPALAWGSLVLNFLAVLLPAFGALRKVILGTVGDDE